MNGQTFSKQTSNNCLNLIRIIAALQVMFGHLVEHLELPINQIFYQVTFFLRGVPIFFVISGFLMWFSIGRSNNYKDYLRKRFWRIYPELWIAVLVEIFVLVVLYRGWNIKDTIFFTFAQGTIFQFWTPDSLRGYGVGTPNGTLWTIGVMIQFYIIAWFFYKVMRNRKIQTWIVGFAVVFGISFIFRNIFHEKIGGEILGKLYDQTFIEYFWLFYIGMFIARYWEKLLPALTKYWYVFLITAFLFFWTGWDLFSGYYLLWSVFLTLGLIGFAYRFPRLSVKPDISFGVFLYHMIIVNIFVYFKWISNWLYALVVFVITAICAYVSTVTIGKWSAKRKTKQANTWN